MKVMALVVLAVLPLACGGRNHAPTVAVVGSVVRSGDATAFSFRVDDADGDPLRVRTGVWYRVPAANLDLSGREWHPPGTVVDVWFNSADAVFRVVASDPLGATATLDVPGRAGSGQ